jgi:hypothetical protein
LAIHLTSIHWKAILLKTNEGLHIQQIEILIYLVCVLFFFFNQASYSWSICLWLRTRMCWLNNFSEMTFSYCYMHKLFHFVFMLVFFGFILVLIQWIYWYTDLPVVNYVLNASRKRFHHILIPAIHKS